MTSAMMMQWKAFTMEASTPTSKSMEWLEMHQILDATGEGEGRSRRHQRLGEAKGEETAGGRVDDRVVLRVCWGRERLPNKALGLGLQIVANVRCAVGKGGARPNKVKGQRRKVSSGAGDRCMRVTWDAGHARGMTAERYGWRQNRGSPNKLDAGESSWERSGAEVQLRLSQRWSCPPEGWKCRKCWKDIIQIIRDFTWCYNPTWRLKSTLIDST
ncbi:hypothetical protein DFH08DRAFT_806937 [Mycena albidolilacea]|uniref:Uncharacterized protein n=1 Tax=Mycena albidolilacea TaxID=1033008 RepID=A0AAD7A4V8_9AGAR|nr:hypothetical protein DFH08DRAFT_806937 [Mycena albidolilacea]